MRSIATGLDRHRVRQNIAYLVSNGAVQCIEQTMMLMFVGVFRGVLLQVSNMEQLFREYSPDMVRVWSPMGLCSVLLPLSVAKKPATELHPSVNCRQL